MPGLLACLALRYDTVRQQLALSGPANDVQSLARLTGTVQDDQPDQQPGDLYFWACMVSHFVCTYHCRGLKLDCISPAAGG